MKLKTRLMLCTALVLGSGGAAFAQVSAQQLADDFVAQGYTYVEVKDAPTQVKVEAIRGDTKVETVFDKATGAVLSTETQFADADEVGRVGVEIDREDDDFAGDDADDDSDEDSDDDSTDDSDDDSGDDSGDDDHGDDDHGDDDHGDDDHGDDDHGDDSDSDGGDD